MPCSGCCHVSHQTNDDDDGGKPQSPPPHFPCFDALGGRGEGGGQGRGGGGNAYLDGKVVNGAPACCAWALDGLQTSGRTLERGDAGLQPCDLPFLFFELSALFLYFLMGDRLDESTMRDMCEGSITV